MVEVFKNVKVDWLVNRRLFIAISVLLMLAGLGSAVVRQWSPGGTEAFNLGVDFKGGTVVTAQVKQRPPAEAIRDALAKVGSTNAVIQPVTDKTDTVLIRLPLEGTAGGPESEAQVDAGRTTARNALNTFGPEAKP